MLVYRRVVLEFLIFGFVFIGICIVLGVRWDVLMMIFVLSCFFTCFCWLNVCILDELGMLN